MKREDVERIAAEYVGGIGVAPCLLDGSEYDADADPPVWRVFFSFREPDEVAIGLPHGLVVTVSDSTGEASHISHL